MTQSSTTRPLQPRRFASIEKLGTVKSAIRPTSAFVMGARWYREPVYPSYIYEELPDQFGGLVAPQRPLRSPRQPVLHALTWQ